MVGVSNPVGAPIPRRYIAGVVGAFQRALPVTRGRAVSVVLVDAATSRRLNRTYRGLNKPTDVLSFPGQDATPWPGHEQIFGEIVICYPIAVAQARELGHGVRREIAELVVHGLSHLAGYDHETPKSAKKMAAVEAAVLKKLRGK
ncbi:MAG: rRNA maturation RNase YbeY [Patescibacteria group bacterium]|nr:rRNA maturation RNase YbeY [Patescibacteria group bacterium]